MEFIRLKQRFSERSHLIHLGRQVGASLNCSEAEMKRRMKALENLVFYKPDILTREILNNFYDSSDQLLACINESLSVIVRQYIEARLFKRKNYYVRRRGRITRYSLECLVSGLNFLPGPFFARINRRLLYVHVDMRELQDDFIKLQEIIRVLKMKGFVIQSEPSPFYRNIAFHDIFELFVESKYSINYIQEILEKLSVVTYQYSPSDSTAREFSSIFDEKRTALFKKSLFPYLKQRIPSLDNKFQRDFIESLVALNLTEDNGKKAVKELEEQLKKYSYHKAKLNVVEMLCGKEQEKLEISNKLQIGPQGLMVTEKGKTSFLFRNKSSEPPLEETDR